MKPLAIALLLSAVLSAQPSFEAASVKPHDPKTPFSKGRILPSGGIEAAGWTVQDLLMFAYGVRPDMIVGLPKWAKESPFDVIAKAPHDTPPATLRVMLQTLLAERFKLASHREDRPMPVYVLTVGKRGHKLQPAAGTLPHCSWIALPNQVSRRDCQNMTMAELAKQLPGLGHIGIDLPVVDKTGLEGAWDFHFDVRLLPPDAGAAEARPEAATSQGPTIFDAFEELGLKLEPHKAPAPVIVVDRIDALSEN
jgi:uncharacterized protein (TIGR03435 family)